MKRLVLILAAVALLPVTAAADDISAELSGACEGIVSLVTTGSTISYGIISDHPDPNSATLTGGGNIDLQANFGGIGSANGTVSASTSDLNNNTGNYTVRVSGPSGTCTGTLVNNGGSTTGSAGVIEFGMGSIAVIDTAGEVEITVNRNGGDEGAVTVDYATADGTATAGSDYTATNGTLNWADGNADPMTITVPIANTDSGGEETFTITLSNPTGGAELGLSAATITITDDQSLICVADENTLCLGADDRFRVRVIWQTADSMGQGTTFDISPRDSGLFYFFTENNIEMLVKVLDGCNIQGFNTFWVFYAATTDQAFTLTVTDTQRNVTRTYSNDLGTAAPPVTDTAAFDTCP